MVALSRIFVSYRREDTAYPSGWLFDKLAQHFGQDQVFKDIDSIDLGDEFVEVITAAVERCEVLLALIGKRWLTASDEDGHQRLDNPTDFVRLEVEAAITRNIRIIPILVDGARMPRADELPPSLAMLARRQALELSPSRFSYGVGQLLRALEKTLTVTQAPPVDPEDADTDLEPPPAKDTDLGDVRNDLAAGWRVVEQRDGEDYQWPELLEHYDRYNVYRGETRREGTVFIALGWTVRHGAWGMDRIYVVSFLSAWTPQTPVTEFLAADDYTETRELIAIIRGRDGGRKMYGPADDPPPAYAQFRTAIYRDRVQAKGSWNKLAVVAAETDTDTILNHALIQARRRGDLDTTLDRALIQARRRGAL
jgi:hypothetical protein